MPRLLPAHHAVDARHRTRRPHHPRPHPTDPPLRLLPAPPQPWADHVRHHRPRRLGRARLPAPTQPAPTPQRHQRLPTPTPRFGCHQRFVEPIQERQRTLVQPRSTPLGPTLSRHQGTRRPQCGLRPLPVVASTGGPQPTPSGHRLLPGPLLDPRCRAGYRRRRPGFVHSGPLARAAVGTTLVEAGLGPLPLLGFLPNRLGLAPLPAQRFGAVVAAVQTIQAEVQRPRLRRGLGGLRGPLDRGAFQAQGEAAAARGGHVWQRRPSRQRLGPRRSAARGGAGPPDPG